jgi:putative membrane-bound dehydrogenase-like protein
MKYLVPACLLVLLSPVPAWPQGFPPEEAVKRMQVPPGFTVQLAACEPELRQPVTMTFDDRGRLWVIQYLQYPNPVGLKPVKVDQYLRTVYDRVPEPPPRGPKGADCITIYEDVRGDGRYRKVKDFVTGLNLASGMALGYGGVFVAQPPYLLFYPDKNGDNVPDGDPEVLLTGFGMEDAHAFANSLQWGPDGWLYGAQGSTVTANIRGISFQQGIWRYHPVTKQFELFAEGGGNTWGLDFDAHGNVIAGTNWGGFTMLHQVQGAYYVKGFAKHGELHNPYAFGYFDHIPYKGFKGGHVTCGGIIYQGGAFPPEYDGVYIAGNLLSNALYWHVLEPNRSSFTSHRGGDFLIANDTWFRPIDCLIGPDGSLFVADWYDKRAAHLDPIDNWDRTNGRIYKIAYRGAPAQPRVSWPLGEKSSRELVDLLRHPNVWYRREARRILSERRDPAVVPELLKAVQTERGPLALESLWALYVSGGFTDARAAGLLNHPDPDVRSWTVHLLGDAKEVSTSIQSRLMELARTEASPTVRCQIACTAKRLPGKQALPIVRELLRHTEDVQDPYIPLLLWWAIEDKAVSHRDAVVSLLTAPGSWENPLVRQVLLERLARRYMAAGSEVDLATCVRLLACAPGEKEAEIVVRGLEKALEGRRLKDVPASLARQVEALWRRAAPTETRTELAVRLGIDAAYQWTLRAVADLRVPAGERVRLIEMLGQIGRPDCASVLLSQLDRPGPQSIRLAALSALQAFPDRRIADRVLALYPKLSPELRGRAQTLLCSRPAGAMALLREVDAGHIPTTELPPDQLRRILLHRDEQIQRLVEKHWGKIGAATAGEKMARLRTVETFLRTVRGDPAHGKLIFTKTCAICHTLFGEGAKIGPDLTGADRKNTAAILGDIIDPSAVIRKEYIAQVVLTTNGRILNGLVVEETPKTVTLVDAKSERTVLAREDVEEMKPSPQSLMPEKLLDTLGEQEIRDLFAYLQGDGTVPAAPSPPTPRPRSGGEGSKSKPLRVCLVSGSLEYKSDESLSALQKYLEEHYPIRCSRAFRRTDDDLPGLQALDTCDVMLLFTRRLTISGEQLERVQRYCRAGKPIVAVRTASHAFQNWLALDREILGGDYRGHYGTGPLTQVRPVESAKQYPILAGVQPFTSPGSLYKNPSLAPDAEVLLTGSIPGHTEPVAWVRQHHGGRAFYTSLGHPEDFKNEQFLRLLVNGLYWTTQH